VNRINTNYTIFGVEPKWPSYHKSDVLRLLVLMNYGGFYFDNDMFIIKPLHKYRIYEMTVSMSSLNGTTTGCQIMIAHRNARLLKAHYDVYR
jgi:mannosyltransferase OCH1-like enzyme